MLPIAIGTPEIAIIVLVVAVLFGIKRLPEMGKSLAQGIHEFKKATKEARKDDTEEEPKTETK